MKKRILCRYKRHFFIGISSFFLLLLIVFFYLHIHEKRLHREDIPDDKSVNESVSNNEDAKIEREIKEDRAQLVQNDIENLLSNQKQYYGIYIKKINSDIEIGINQNDTFFPASLYKVVTTILVLRDVESGEYTLQDTLQLTEANKQYGSDPFYAYENGTFHTRQALLESAILYSDSTAWDILQDSLEITDIIDQRTHDELDLKNTSRTPFVTTAKDYGKMLENVYSYAYLNKKNSDYLIDLLSKSISYKKIQEGLPEGTRVAHKYGSLGNIYQEAGIVFGNKADFIIVVLNHNATISDAQKKITSISKMAWDFFEKEEAYTN